MDVKIIDSSGDVVVVGRNVDYDHLVKWLKSYVGYDFHIVVLNDELSKS